MSSGWIVSVMLIFVFFFKQKTAYEMRISDWSSDVCSSDLAVFAAQVAVENQVHAVLQVFPVHAVSPDSMTQQAAGEGDAEHGHRQRADHKIGRASCRESVCQYV